MTIQDGGPAVSAPNSARRPRAGLLTAIAVGIGIGVLTAYAQGWLSDSSASLANSAGPWSVAAFLVARANRRVLRAMFASVATLACCELGYVLTTHLRGGSNATSTVVFWLLAAMFAGPPLGIAGSWSTRFGARSAVGFAVIAGVLLGEGLYGWSRLADTTDWRYWAAETALGVAAETWAALRNRRVLDALLAFPAGMSTALVVYVVARIA